MNNILLKGTFVRIAPILILFVSIGFADPQIESVNGVTQDSSQAIADEIVKSEIPVLVDFWAAWCKPCHMLTPIIKEIQKQYEGKILVKKVNVDVHRKIASYFRVNSIPSIYIIKNKTVVKLIPGVQPQKVYTDAIEEVIGGISQKKESPGS